MRLEQLFWHSLVSSCFAVSRHPPVLIPRSSFISVGGGGTRTLSAKTPQEQRGSRPGKRSLANHLHLLFSARHTAARSRPLFDFQYDDMWHLAHQYFIYGLSAFTESLDFHLSFIFLCFILVHQPASGT